MENALKNEITEFIKQALSLPENAVIMRGSVQITEDDDVKIIGSTAVEFQDKTPAEPGDLTEVIIPSEPRTKRGKKAKKDAEPKGSTSHVRAREGEGANIKESQIKGWRIILGIRERAGQLSAPQIAALKATKGMHAGKLSAEQKQQIKDIFDETTPKQY